jgi:hypothetical protein
MEELRSPKSAKGGVSFGVPQNLSARPVLKKMNSNFVIMWPAGQDNPLLSRLREVARPIG